MKFCIEQSKIEKCLEVAFRIVSKQQSSAIFSHVLLKISENDINSLIIQSSNLLVFYHKTIDITEGQSGDFCVDAKQLYNIVKGYAFGSIVIEKKNDNLHISSIESEAKYVLNYIPSDDFPEKPVMEDNGQRATVIKDEFIKAINLIQYAQSRESGRFNLNGVFFSNSNNKFELVATNGRQLAFYNYISELGFLNELAVIIPVETIELLNSLLSVDEFDLIVNQTSLFFIFDNTFFATTLQEGNFPDYTKILPDLASVHKCVLNRNELQAKLKSIDAVPHEYNLVVLSFNTGCLEIIRSGGYGKAVNKIEMDNNIDLKIGVSLPYLMDIVKILDSENIEMYFSDSASPIVFLGSPNKYGTHIVMPMKIK